MSYGRHQSKSPFLVQAQRRKGLCVVLNLFCYVVYRKWGLNHTSPTLAQRNYPFWFLRKLGELRNRAASVSILTVSRHSCLVWVSMERKGLHRIWPHVFEEKASGQGGSRGLILTENKHWSAPTRKKRGSKERKKLNMFLLVQRLKCVYT